MVDHRDADAHRSGLGRPVDAHHAAHRLQHGVVAGQAAQRAIGAEARDRAVDEARMPLRERVVAEAPLLHRAGQEILDQHVGALEQAREHRLSGRLAEIERERALAAIDRGEVGGVAVLVERRAEQARLVAERRLDLDHVRAVVGEHLRAQRTRQHARQVDHPNAVERAHRHAARRQFHDARAHRRQLAVLVVRLLRDFHQMLAVRDELAGDRALDEQQVAFGIVPPHLARGAAQEAVVAHPVGELVREPGAALRAVVVRAGRAHFQREVLFPVHALGHVGNAEAILDADARDARRSASTRACSRGCRDRPSPARSR